MDQFSDGDISDITSQLSRAELQRLYVKLKLRHNEIENAEDSANSRDNKFQAASVLRYWRQIKGKAATRQQIISALNKCRLTDAKEALQEDWGLEDVEPASTPSLRKTARKSDSSPKQQLKEFMPLVMKKSRLYIIFYNMQSSRTYHKNQSGIPLEPAIQPPMSDVPTKTGITTLVTDRDIQTIARDIGLKRDDFHLIYKELGLSSDIVEDAEEAAGFKTLVLKATDVLEKWRQINGKHATRDKILKALHNATLNDALRILENKWAVNSAQ